MFSQQNYQYISQPAQTPYQPSQNPYPQYPPQLTQAQATQYQMRQQPSQLPPQMHDTFSCYSGQSTTSGLSQMTSLYMVNQKKKILTDEIIQCLNSTLKNLLPEVARQTAEKIYDAFLPYIQKQNAEIEELQKQTELLSNVFKNLSFWTNDKEQGNWIPLQKSMNNIQSNINTCNILLNNQINTEENNSNYVSSHIDKIKELNSNINDVKMEVEKQKEGNNLINSKINDTFSNMWNFKNSMNKQMNEVTGDLMMVKNCSNDKDALYTGDIKEDEIMKGIEEVEQKVGNFYNEVKLSKAIGVKAEPNNMNQNSIMEQNTEYTSEYTEVKENKNCKKNNNTFLSGFTF